MEKKMFYTLIKSDHKFGANDYIKGRISGYKELICDGNNNGIDEPGYAIRVIPGVGELTRTCCEPEKYEIFKNLVEKHYPGLCKFDYNKDDVK